MTLIRNLLPANQGAPNEQTAGQTGQVEGKKLALRLKTASHAAVSIHPLESQDGVIIKVTPPKEPTPAGLKHVPCDIVLVIDVSGSMQVDAPIPTSPGETAERTGLSVLDLVKHASRTILETLDENDRLGIITFSSVAKVVQTLTHMSPGNKEAARVNISNMHPDSATNMWHGILQGIKLFRDDKAADGGGRVPAIMILTDGIPNHMCPNQGYIPKIRQMKRLPATLHTFGFGYSLRSGLLKSIAEIGGGNYAFIPDAGMIGTIFVHAVANLQSTFATNANLRVTYPSGLGLEQTTGDSVKVYQPVEEDNTSAVDGECSLLISLGNIQYGQSRDIYLRYSGKSTAASAERPASRASDSTIAAEDPVISATLEYSRMTPLVYKATARRSLLAPTDLPPEEVAFHVSRSALCAFISSLFPIIRPAEGLTDERQGEHRPVDFSEQLAGKLDELAASVPAARLPDSAANAALAADIRGQVRQALQSRANYERWGVHFLPSLHAAHAAQQCNSFKDPGPLRYGAGSPLFVRCRDALDELFDSLPAPEPSNAYSSDPFPSYAAFYSGAVTRGATTSPGRGATAPKRGGGFPQGKERSRGQLRMSAYHRASNPCFAGFCAVRLADGRDVRVGRLRRGALVATPRGPRAVAAVLRTRVAGAPMVWLGPGVVVTPWHPVRKSEAIGGRNGGEEEEGDGWVFPARYSQGKGCRVRYTGSIYSILLQRDSHPDAHAVLIGGSTSAGNDAWWGATLGHGVVNRSNSNTSSGNSGVSAGDVRAHRFLGDYSAVVQSLVSLGVARNGLVLGGGVIRDRKTGLVCGFRRASPRQPRPRSRRTDLDLVLGKLRG